MSDNIACVAYINHLRGASTQLSNLAWSLCGYSLWPQYRANLTTLSGYAQHSSWWANLNNESARVQIAPKLIWIHKQNFWTTQHHHICFTDDRATIQTQLYAIQSSHRRCGGNGTKLERGKQLHKPTILNLDNIVEGKATSTIIVLAWLAQPWYWRLQIMTSIVSF